MSDSNQKYITFKREEFFGLFGDITETISDIVLADAVVIRRQDLFASPALATYASCIGMVAVLSEPEIKRQLLAVSDYFEQQAKLAAEEGYKLPDV